MRCLINYKIGITIKAYIGVVNVNIPLEKIAINVDTGMVYANRYFKS